MAAGANRLQHFLVFSFLDSCCERGECCGGYEKLIWFELSFLLTAVNALFFTVIYLPIECSESAEIGKNKSGEVITLGALQALYHRLQTRNSVPRFPFRSVL